MSLKNLITPVLLSSIVLWADNPLSNNYLADPAVAIVGDSVFYIIADTDYDNVPDAEGKTHYNMKAAYLLSSKDMKNWTDHGEIFRVPQDVSWAGGVWAPAAVWRDGKMWIYFPNGGYGVGVVSSSNPAGPYKDPVGKLLVGGAIGCDGVAWCFDPGIFVDTDGQAYLHWGGGSNDARPYGNNFSIVKLKSDMITADGATMKMTGMTNSFEASYINKRDGKYYLSYNTQDQKIGYSISSSPTGPWTSMGIAMANPNINGQNINAYNNSHHAFGEFKGKWYAAYHDRRVAIAKNDAEPAFHRSVSIDLLEFESDGKIKPFVYTNNGPAQMGTFNPYDSIPAVTGSLSNNIKTQSVTVTNAPSMNLLLPIPSGSNGSWMRLSNVNIGTVESLTFKVNAASTSANNKVEIRTGSATGTLVGTCTLPNTGSLSSFGNSECAVTGLNGVVSELYLKFTGSDNTAAIKWWRFIKPAIPQGPYNAKASIPGTIEMENYDVGGEGVAYHDNDAINSGNVFRTDGVDITGDAIDGYKLGWTVAGEWTEYTLNIESGDYDWKARVSSGLDGASFRMMLDNVDITENLSIPNTGDWNIYDTIQGTVQGFTSGEHVLKIVMEGSYGNLDWIQFRKSVPVSISKQESYTTPETYYLMDLQHHILGLVRVTNAQNTQKMVREHIQVPGVYLLKSLHSGRSKLIAID